MMATVNMVCVKDLAGVRTTPPPKAKHFAIKTALGFLSCLQCWMPTSIVVSFNNVLATGEFINGAAC